MKLGSILEVCEENSIICEIITAHKPINIIHVKYDNLLIIHLIYRRKNRSLEGEVKRRGGDREGRER